MTQKAKAVCTGLGLSLIFAVCLFSTYSQMFVVSGSNQLSCVDGKELIKYWAGDGLSTVTNVKIVDQNDTVLYNDGVPATHVIDIKGLYHNDNVTVTWTDWRGSQSEVIEVGCTDAICRVTNTIPSLPVPPKSTQTNLEV